jgi:hypothetical protein
VLARLQDTAQGPQQHSQQVLRQRCDDLLHIYHHLFDGRTWLMKTQRAENE